MEKLSLSDLLLFIKAGDAEAFRELYHRYKEKTYWMIYRRLGNEEEAKDMVQEIFLSLWTGRERLAGLDVLDAYLYGMARNKIISLYRKKDTQFKGDHYLYSSLEQLDVAADDHLITRELNDQVEEVVARLPATMRACFQLNKNEGKKVQDIAALLNLSEQTVRNNLSEALRRLRISLQGNYPELLLLAVVIMVKD